MQNYFTKVLEDNLKPLIKPQYVDHIPRAIKGKQTVEQMLDGKLERDNKEEILTALDLHVVLSREVSQLSGGELQRFAIGMSCVQKADMYVHHSSTSSRRLTIREKLHVRRTVFLSRRQATTQRRPHHSISPRAGGLRHRRRARFVGVGLLVGFHLLSLRNAFDVRCRHYAVLGSRRSVMSSLQCDDELTRRLGINIFLDGKIPTENLRFREESLHFKISESAEEFLVEKNRRYQYPSMEKTLGNFKLTVEEGSFTDSEIIVMLGENGTGKTTFVKLLAGKMDPDSEEDKMHLNVSMKPQTIAPKFPGTVRELLLKQMRASMMHAQFNTDVIKPMQLEIIMDQYVTTLSGGELQRVAIVLCLGKPADIYLIDEPSAYLDSEQRIIAARVIKRSVLPFSILLPLTDVAMWIDSSFTPRRLRSSSSTIS